MKEKDGKLDALGTALGDIGRISQLYDSGMEAMVTGKMHGMENFTLMMGR